MVWHGVMLCLFCADRGMFGGACTSCFHSDRPHSVFAVSRTGNSSAGEALAECCGSTIITAGSGPCHITQQYKFDLDQVWAHDYISVKLAERLGEDFMPPVCFYPGCRGNALCRNHRGLGPCGQPIPVAALILLGQR